MSKFTNVELEDLVKCVICMEVFEDPIALCCLHTVCASCINVLQKRFVQGIDSFFFKSK